MSRVTKHVESSTERGDPAGRVGGLRRRLRGVWGSYQGIILLLLLVGALILGYIGYRQYYNDAGQSARWFDLVYLDLQLLTFNTQVLGDGTTELPSSLEIARFLAPLVAGYSALRALASLFRDRVDQSRARFRRGHVIVAGAGDTGLAFVRALRQADRKVVVIDQEVANANLEACRQLGALVVHVDATQPESLIQAGIIGADHLIAVCGDDGKNTEITLNAQQIKRRPTRPLRCLAHVVDPDLWHLLRAVELRAGDDLAVRFSFFNIYEHGARALLDTHPPLRDQPDRPPRVLVVGDGPLAEQVITQLARRWDAQRSTPDQATVTLLAPRATALKEELSRRLTHLDDVVGLTAVDTTLDTLPVAAEGDLGDVGIAYVCPDTDPDGLTTAQILRDRLPTAPIVVCLTRSPGLTRVMQDSQLVGRSNLGQIQPFPILDRTCHLDTLLAGTSESLAQAIHSRFRRDELNRGADPADPRLANWDDLQPDLVASNRSQAADIGDKLRLVGCDVLPQRGWATSAFEFTATEVETLAAREHERWAQERHAQGWHHGPERDTHRRLNPLLVPWDRLPESARRQNRDIVTAIPEVVSRAGFQVVRVLPGPTTEPDWLENVAQAIHDRYLTQRQSDGTFDAQVSAVPWHQLPDRLRESNRAQAADITRKCAAVGCRVVPLSSHERFPGFTDQEVENLARLEHARWVASQPITPTGSLEADNLRHTDFAPWEQLPEARRELDREAVRAIPDVLAVAGLTLARDPGPEPPDPTDSAESRWGQP